ncbi:MAG: proline--tRNA ligase [Deltaproteobacteria bacterium]|nr:proline--tRNA ligase [Deltaproteobacteria bacterium]
MRYSRLFLPTLRQVPSDAEIVSHQLMMRAGMIRKLTSGVYIHLPLGLRIIKKVETIIREEMEKAGAQEILMPAMQPAELWQESGRWDIYGKELLRFKDRHGRPYCLGPTHEEVITDLVRREVRSYRDMPLILYQIQNKFRDEIRPRFGLMRGREFAMKDAYSFDVDEEAAAKSYEKMFDAYNRIFERCGLRFRAVEADTGTIGGSFSHEFMVVAETGEDAIVICTKCGYAANLEKAEVHPGYARKEEYKGPDAPMTKVSTPNIRTVEEVTQFLSVHPRQLVKTIIFETSSEPVAVLVRGDHEVNAAKVKNILGVDNIELADEDTVLKLTGAPTGFAGPVGLSIKIIADRAVEPMKNMVAGANERDFHLVGTNRGRDFEVSEFADLRLVTSSDLCPRCGMAMELKRGIEVGHVFRLGDKYSKALSSVYVDQDGNERYTIMGCYGIGVWRTVAAAIEQNHDKDGIIFPPPLAPYQVEILPLQIQEGDVIAAAETLYDQLSTQGAEVLLDDRDERAGVKFKDADLIGIPIRVTIGKKSLKNGEVEVRLRSTGRTEMIQREGADRAVLDMIRKQMT